MKSLFIGLVCLVLAGCGPSQRSYNELASRSRELEQQVVSLRAELEDIKYGAGRMLALAKTSINSGDLAKAKEILLDLTKRHPASPEATEGSTLLPEIEDRIIAAEIARKVQLDKEAESRRQAEAKIAQNLAFETDDIKGVTWVKHREAPILGNYVALYFGSEKGAASTYPVRLKVQYYDDSWLFAHSLTVKADDKVDELGELDFKRDNGSGKIWEWIDIPVKDHPTLVRWLNSRKLVVRFNGDKYYNDFVVPAAQQTQMREIYEAWRRMGGKV